MSNLKSKTVSIVQKGVNFAPAAVFFGVGGTPLNKAGEPCVDAENNPLFPNVKAIKYCKFAYGQGAAVNQPCYVVSFEDSMQVVVIPETDVTQITIQKLDKEDNIPALPDN